MTSSRRTGMRKLVVTVTAPPTTAAGSGLGAFLERAAPAKAAGTITIALVSDQRIRQLNRQFRAVDTSTDVLSFPAGDELRMADAKSHPINHLGDIAIALGVARRQAAERGHSLQTELRVLALHGLLHLMGYDHERDRGEMRRLEERLRRRAGLAEGLITRVRS